LISGRMYHTDLVTAFNLVVCYFATGDKEKMKQGFVRMLQIRKETLDMEAVDDLDIRAVLDAQSPLMSKNSSGGHP
jgi:hypothetical protein